MRFLPLLEPRAMPVFGLKTQPGYRYHMAMATQHATRRKLSGLDRTAPAHAAEFRFISKHQQINICARESVSQSRPKEEIA